MSDTDFNTLAEALAEATPVLRPESLAASITSTVVALSETGLDELMTALTSLMGLRRLQDSTLEEIARRLAASDDLETPEEERDRFVSRLSRVMDTRPVRLLGKAVDLGSEHDKVFIGARVLTDLRPIFGEDIQEAPEGAVLSHTLKLEFVHEGGKVGNTYVVLDKEDLQALQKALGRAEGKGETMKQVMDTVGLTYLGPEA